MDKKKQIILFLSIFSLIVTIFSVTSINPDVMSFYEKLFDVSAVSDDYGLNLFLKPFTGMVSFFIVLLSIAAGVLLTSVFVLVFPFITTRNLSLQDGQLVPYLGSKIRLFCIIVMIVVAILGSIVANPFLALLAMLVYVLPMYIAYYLANKAMFVLTLRKMRRAEEAYYQQKYMEENSFQTQQKMYNNQYNNYNQHNNYNQNYNQQNYQNNYQERRDWRNDQRY